MNAEPKAAQTTQPLRIADAVASIAQSCPDKLAVRAGDTSLSYDALHQAAQALARHLMDCGAAPGSIVAVLLPRGSQLITALLAIARTGAAYLPIDPDYPAARIAHLLGDSAAPLVVTSERLRGLLSDANKTKVITVDRIPTAASSASVIPGSVDDPFYVIYTSGSTGTPKGTLLHERGVANLYAHYAAAHAVGPDSRYLVVSSIGFDLTQKNLWVPLMHGGTVVFTGQELFDAALILDTIARAGVTHLNCTPSAFEALLEGAGEAEFAQLASLKVVQLGGEAIRPQRLQAWWQNPHNHAALFNGYGPTECSAVVAMHRIDNGTPLPATVPIGKAVPGLELRVLDAHLQPVMDGMEGELLMGGVGVGLGYLNRPELTAEKFIRLSGEQRLFYRSGDRVRRDADGTLHYLGRLDDQIKLGGHRIELGEIDAALVQLPGVRAAASLIHDDRLCAYLVASDERTHDVETLRSTLRQQLPDFMLPTVWQWLPALPLNAHGKLDRKALPRPSRERPALAAAFAAPVGVLEQAIASEWQAVLGLDAIGRDDPFFDLGGSSLNALSMVARLGRVLGMKLPIAGFFAAGTVRRYAESLGRSHTAAVTARLGYVPVAAADMALTSRKRGHAADDIAIVGMTVRVPGANDIGTFWHNLQNGIESIRDISEAELDAAGVSAETRSNPDYVKRVAVCDDADKFDAGFFGYTPRDAELLDPQQRLLLETAWAAMEQAGIDPQHPGGRVGVFAGVARNSYFQLNLAANPATQGRLAEVTLTFANDKDYAATRIAHKLNFKGPALTAQTACSTGGVLLHLARQSLLAGECDLAIVGGARVVTPLTAGYPWIDGNIFSKDGHMKVFDACGTGMIRGSGAATLVLKRKADALRDGDHLHALIKGSALNNDGADKVGYTAPSVPGQAEVIRLALADAGVAAESISYLEAHGTATFLGDPIEVTALNEAYRAETSKVGFCRIGSVKSNIGHLDPAAALVSVIKTALALEHRSIPPTLHFQSANPNIPFAGSPFVVADKLVPWQSSGVRRAGVSSFGIGGTNAHLILEEAPVIAAAAAATREWQLLPFSAKTPEALAASAARLATHFSALDTTSLADAAYTLQTGRASLAQRGFVVARTASDAAAAFKDVEQWNKSTAGTAHEVAFVFPGQGSQHPDMGRALYESEAVFKQVIDEGAVILQPLLGLDLRTVLYPGASDADSAAETLKQTGLAQPAIYLISLATARLWQSWGVQPAAMLGHSVGEYVAATLAGVFTFADALKVLATRARLMQSMPAGSMLAVRLPEAEVRSQLKGAVSIAAINAPKLTIVSGPTDEVAAFDAALKASGAATVALHTSHAFHSAMMDPVLVEFTATVASVPRAAPMLPIISTLTGELLTAELAQSPEYWARQLREAVRFAPAVTTATQTVGRVLLEVGPGQSLGGPLRQTAGNGVTVISSLPAAAQADANAAAQMLAALGKLWSAGLPLDWKKLHGGVRAKVSLPTYPFARTRHWIEGTHPLDGSHAAIATEATTGSRVEAALEAPSKPDLASQIAAIIDEVTGIKIADGDTGKTFLELGMDSLVLTQIAGKLKNAFRVDLRFRQLLENLNTLVKLADWLAAQGATSIAAKAEASADSSAASSDARPKKIFGAAVRISKDKDKLAPAQRRALDALMARYIARTGKSKASAQQHRRYFADPRTVSGFKPMWKESVYPIVSTRSDGPYLWDVDGHRYIDTVNGFGATLFGHKPKFVDEALKAQIDKGYEVGPVQDFLGELSDRFTRMVKLDRVAFCNTGSEAVSAAQRCARTATGKDLIASFNGDYHGVHDEVIVRPGPGGKGFPAASGIPNAHTSQTLILDYNDPKSLEILRTRADELAAIMIEPIQSRNQDLQPREYIHQLREIATQANCAFIMDEVITGFRIAPGGAQEFFGIKADLATYGKVFGGGIPVGAVAGIPRYMDALDGGYWSFGDDSVPEAGVTFFAGTFVRHPLAMAASLASLKHLEANPGIQHQLNTRVIAFVKRLREAIAALNAPVRVTSYTSIYRFEAAQEEPFFELLAHYFRLNGIHTYDHRNQVMTTAHTEAVFDEMFKAYIGGIEQMQKDGLLGRIGEPVKLGLADTRPGAIWYAQPEAHARLGRAADGNPAWFIPDPARPGHFVQLEETA